MLFVLALFSVPFFVSMSTLRSPTPPPKSVMQYASSSPRGNSSAPPAGSFAPPPPGYVHHVVVSHVGPNLLRDPTALSPAVYGLDYYKQAGRRQRACTAADTPACRALAAGDSTHAHCNDSCGRQVLAAAWSSAHTRSRT